MFLQKIDRYLFKNIVNYSVFYTIIPTFILWVVQSRHILELAMGSKTSLWITLKLSSYLIPPILPHILPFAILLGCVTVLVRLYNDSEMSVLWTSGLSPLRLTKSLYGIAFLGMVLILSIHQFIAPQMSRQLKIELFNIKNDILQTALKPNILQSIPEQNLTLYIDKISNNTFIEGFYLQQKTDDNLVRIFTAKQALLTDKDGDFQLLLLKGRIINWHDPNNTMFHKETVTDYKTASSILEFDKFTLNISDIISNFNKSQDLAFKARDYAISDLLSAKDAKTLDDKRHFIANGHEHIVTGFFPLIFVSFTILFMMRPIPPRGFPYMLILLTIAVAVLYRIASSAVYNYAENNVTIIYFVYGLHGSIFMAIYGFTALKRNSLT